MLQSDTITFIENKNILLHRAIPITAIIVSIKLNISCFFNDIISINQEFIKIDTNIPAFKKVNMLLI